MAVIKKILAFTLLLIVLGGCTTVTCTAYGVSMTVTTALAGFGPGANVVGEVAARACEKILRWPQPRTFDPGENAEPPRDSSSSAPTK